MARQLQSSVTGTVGNLTFYKLWNQYYVRTKSPGGKQTENTKASQQHFAQAVRLAAVIRRLLHPAIPYPANKDMQNRLLKATLQWFRSANKEDAEKAGDDERLQGFQFVNTTPLASRLQIEVEARCSSGNSLFICLPSFIPRQHIIAPVGTREVLLTIACGSYCTIENKIRSTFSHTISIPYTGSAQKGEEIKTGIKAGQGLLVVAAVSISYKVKHLTEAVKVQQSVWQAASIISITCSSI